MPHDNVQCVKFPQDEYPPSTGQGKTLHDRMSIDGPIEEQLFPLYCGSGSVQFLYRVIVPFPQLLLQALKFDQDE